MLFPLLDKIRARTTPSYRKTTFLQFLIQATVVQCTFTSTDRMKINYDENKSLGGGGGIIYELFSFSSEEVIIVILKVSEKLSI